MLSKKEKTLYPWADERVYAKKLIDMLEKLEKSVTGFVKSDNGLEGREKRFDQFLDTLKPMYGQGFAHDVVKTMINGVNRMVTVQLNKSIERHDVKKLVRDALGDLTDNETKLMNAKLAENISLIKSVGDEYLNKVQDAVYRGWSTGQSQKDLITAIRGAASENGITTVSENRAKLIARDQVGSLAGQLNRYKSQSAGINYFTWETANDERVRPAHHDIDGKIFTWSNGWAGVYPGDPIQCRCVADAVFDDEAADAEDSDFWDPEAEDAVFPSKKNGSPNPPDIEPVAVEKPEMPYYGNLENKPDWLKSSTAKLDLPTTQQHAEISTAKVESLPAPKKLSSIDSLKSDFYKHASKIQMQRATERLSLMKPLEEFSESDIIEVYKHIGEPKSKFLAWLKTKSQEFQNKFGITTLFNAGELTKQIEKTNMANEFGEKTVSKFTQHLEGLSDGKQRKLYEHLSGNAIYQRISDSEIAHVNFQAKNEKGWSINLSNECFRGNYYKSPFSTVYHEHAHMFDRIGSIALDRGKSSTFLSQNPKYQLSNTIDKDVNDLLSRFKNGSEIENFFKEYEKNGTHFAAISDIIEGATGYSLGYGHGADYWLNGGSRESEFFAEVSETLNADRKQYNLLKKLLPESVKKYHEIVNDLLLAVEKDGGNQNG